MPTKKNDPNQSHSGLEDDNKAPTMDPAGKPGDDHPEGEGGDRGRVNRGGLGDEGGPLHQRDQDVPTRQGDDLGNERDDKLETEAENDAGYDGGAKTQPR